MVKIQLDTSMGEILLELDEVKAPISVENFLAYADSGHYEGTLFHRVIPGFMIQAGGYDKELQKKPMNDPIQNEATNGLKNVRGSIAMARTPDINSATAQFFINLDDNDFLNHRSEDDEGYGYAVFGAVLQGMDIVDKIAALETAGRASFNKDVPVDDVTITSVTRI
jgi:peptidyl-prolyl cis-trans isomerase B (cyclophilin B)